MSSTLKLLNTLLPLLYGAAASAYAADFFREDPLAGRWARPLLKAALAAHALFLAIRTFVYAHVPLASIPEVLTSVAFALALVYLCVESRSGIQRTGMFVLTFSFAFQTLASSFIGEAQSFPEILRSPLFALHTGAAVLGYTAFAVSAIYGVLYLLLYHELKKSHFGLVYRRLPPLDVLARLSLRATILGATLLTVTIAIGCLWASSSVKARSSSLSPCSEMA